MSRLQSLTSPLSAPNTGRKNREVLVIGGRHSRGQELLQDVHAAIYTVIRRRPIEARIQPVKATVARLLQAPHLTIIDDKLIGPLVIELEQALDSSLPKRSTESSEELSIPKSTLADLRAWTSAQKRSLDLLIGASRISTGSKHADDPHESLRRRLDEIESAVEDYMTDQRLKLKSHAQLAGLESGQQQIGEALRRYHAPFETPPALSVFGANDTNENGGAPVNPPESSQTSDTPPSILSTDELSQQFDTYTRRIDDEFALRTQRIMGVLALERVHRKISVVRRELFATPALEPGTDSLAWPADTSYRILE